MRVRLCAGARMAGPTGCFGPGAIVELAEATAQVMIANGLAEPAPAVVEEARVAAPEAAVALPQRPRGRKRPVKPVTVEVQDGDIPDDIRAGRQ